MLLEEKKRIVAVATLNNHVAKDFIVSDRENEQTIISIQKYNT